MPFSHRQVLGRAIAVLFSCTLTAYAAPPSLVIRDAAVFDSIHGAMLPNRTVLIEGDHIRSLVPAEERVSIPSGAQIIDGRGKFVLPGLIDAHVHLVHVLDFAHVTGDEILPLFLANGVTSVRDTGDVVVAEKLVARYAEAHPDLSPRIFLCSPLIDGDPPFHKNDVGRAIVDPAEVPKFVTDMIEWGVGTFKLYVGTERPVGRRVIEEVHRRGKIVCGHLGKYSAQDAVADGIDVLEHIWSVFNYILPAEEPRPLRAEEREKLSPAEKQALGRRRLERRAQVDLGNPKVEDLVASMLRQKVKVDPTLTVFKNMILLNDLSEVYQHPDNDLMPERLKKNWSGYRQESNLDPETLELRRQEFRKYQELTGILYRKGVPLLAGTDTPEPYCPPGSSLHQELELLVESGLTPAAALQSATIENARALQQADRLGSVETNKLADLVILDANPLQDIRNTRKIFKVIRGGILCDPKIVLKLVPSH